MTHGELSGLLAANLGGRVLLSISRRGRTVARRTDLDGGFLMIRLHHGFLGAPPSVLDRLLGYLRDPDDENLLAELERFCAAADDGPSSQHRRDASPALRNRFHDLSRIFADLNRRFFRGKLRCRIAWGRKGKRRRKSSIQLGSYTFEDDLIRIHPALDQASIPSRYVEYVVFHEMLHVVIGGYRDVTGRRVFHGKDFDHFEKMYPHYAWAREWEKRNIRFLLDS